VSEEDFLSKRKSRGAVLKGEEMPLERGTGLSEEVRVQSAREGGSSGERKIAFCQEEGRGGRSGGEVLCLSPLQRERGSGNSSLKRGRRALSPLWEEASPLRWREEGWGEWGREKGRGSSAWCFFPGEGE